MLVKLIVLIGSIDVDYTCAVQAFRTSGGRVSRTTSARQTKSAALG